MIFIKWNKNLFAFNAIQHLPSPTFFIFLFNKYGVIITSFAGTKFLSISFSSFNTLGAGCVCACKKPKSSLSSAMSKIEDWNLALMGYQSRSRASLNSKTLPMGQQSKVRLLTFFFFFKGDLLKGTQRGKHLQTIICDIAKSIVYQLKMKCICLDMFEGFNTNSTEEKRIHVNFFDSNFLYRKICSVKFLFHLIRIITWLFVYKV